MPPLRRVDVRDRIGPVVDHGLRRAVRARRKIVKHRIGGVRLHPLPLRLILGGLCHQLIPKQEAVIFLPDGNDGNLPPVRCLLHLLADVLGPDADDGFHIRGFDPLGNVLRGHHMGSGNRDRPELVKRKHRDPKLVPALQKKHYCGPPSDPEFGKCLRCRVGQLLQIAEGKPCKGPVQSDVDHRRLIRTFLRKPVDDIIRKIKMRRDLRLNPHYGSVFRKNFVIILLVEVHIPILPCTLCRSPLGG